MRLVRLRLVNFRRHVATDIEWPDGVTALLGRNGQGKSTLLEAITFALYGTKALTTNKDLVRFEGAAQTDAVSVLLEAEMAGQAVAITRELRGRNLTPQASLTVDGVVVVPTGAGSDNAVTSEITKRLGMDLATFVTTVVARQKDLDRLTDLKPAERKRLILNMLGVDRLDAAIQTARERRRSAESLADNLRQDLPDLKQLKEQVAGARKSHGEAMAQAAQAEKSWQHAKDELATKAEAAAAAQEAAKQHEALVAGERQARTDLAAAKERLDEATRRHAAAEAAAARVTELAPQVEQLKPAEEQLAKAEDAARHRQQAEALRKEAELVTQQLSALDGVEDPGPAVEQARNQADEIQTEIARVAAAVEHAQTTAKRLRERHRRLHGLDDVATCPTCEQTVQGEHLQVLLGRASEEFEAIEAERQGNEKRLAALRQSAQEHGQRLTELEQQARAFTARLQEQQRLEQRLDDLNRQVAKVAATDAGGLVDVEPLREQVATYRQARDETLRLEHLAGSVPETASQVEEATKRVIAAEATLAVATQQVAEHAKQSSAWQSAIQAHEAATLRERQAERDHLLAMQAVQAAEAAASHAQERLDDAHKRRERVKEHQVQAQYWGALAGGRGATGLLDRFKEHLVARIGPAVSAEASRLMAAFTGGRYGELILDDQDGVFLMDGGTRYRLDRFSGGEQDLAHLALRLAVSRLLVSRAGGADVRFLALDEVFGSLDRERRDTVLGAMQGLGDLYAQVLCITHLDDLRDALDHCMEVDGQDGVAHVLHHA